MESMIRNETVQDQGTGRNLQNSKQSCISYRLQTMDHRVRLEPS